MVQLLRLTQREDLTATDCTALSFEFSARRKRRVAADVSGGEIASNGGVLLLRRADRLIGLTACVARRLTDARRRGKVEHGFAALPRQRVFALALGYEDVNPHPEPVEGRRGAWASGGPLLPRLLERLQAI